MYYLLNLSRHPSPPFLLHLMQKAKMVKRFVNATSEIISTLRIFSSAFRIWRRFYLIYLSCTLELQGGKLSYIFRGQMKIIWNSFWSEGAPVFSKDLYEILIHNTIYIFWILNKCVWNRRCIKSPIFLLFIRYSFKIGPFMIYEFCNTF